MRYHVGLNGEEIPSELPTTFEAVGLIRGEYLCRRAGAYVTQQSCRNVIASYCYDAASIFKERPVWYRFIDMETSELNVTGGVDHIVSEKTTMLGLRGIRRAMAFPETFALEVRCLVDVASERPNLNLLFPFVSSPGEIKWGVDYLRQRGFRGRIGMMAETPSAILDLPSCLEAGVDHVLVGLNDLSSLTFGAYRGSGLDRKHSDPMGRLLRTALAYAAREGVSISAAGYLTSSTVQWLSELGFESVAVHLGQYRQTVDGLRLAPMENSIKEVRELVGDPRFDPGMVDHVAG